MSRLKSAMSAVRANPQNAEAWADLGNLLLEAGQLEKAKQSYQRALQLEPNNEAAKEGLTLLLMGGSATRAAPSRPTIPERVSDVPSAPRYPSPSAYVEEEEEDEEEKISFSGILPEGTAPAQKKIIFRDPPPETVKPSAARMWLGALGLLLFLFLCVCGGLYGLQLPF